MRVATAADLHQKARMSTCQPLKTSFAFGGLPSYSRVVVLRLRWSSTEGSGGRTDGGGWGEGERGRGGAAWGGGVEGDLLTIDKSTVFATVKTSSYSPGTFT